MLVLAVVGLAVVVDVIALGTGCIMGEGEGEGAGEKISGFTLMSAQFQNSSPNTFFPSGPHATFFFVAQEATACGAQLPAVHPRDCMFLKWWM